MKAKEYFNYYKTEHQDKSWEWRIVNVLKMCLLEMEKRKVLYKKWIPAEYIGVGGARKRKDGTGCFEKEFSHAGLFHQWAAAYEEFENGPGNYTTALIETPEGTIDSVLPQNLKFVKN